MMSCVILRSYCRNWWGPIPRSPTFWKNFMNMPRWYVCKIGSTYYICNWLTEVLFRKPVTGLSR